MRCGLPHVRTGALVSIIFVTDNFLHLPKIRSGVAKYGGFMTECGGKGLFTAKLFQDVGHLSPKLVQMLVGCGNNGLAQSTWSGYGGVRKHLAACSRVTRGVHVISHEVKASTGLHIIFVYQRFEVNHSQPISLWSENVTHCGGSCSA